MPRSKKQKQMSKRTAKRLEQKQQEQFLSAQDSIFYDYMLQDGLCVLGDGIYSRSFQFDDINYRLSYEENQKDICKQLSEVYNYLDADTFYQLLLVNRTGDRSDFMQEMLYTLRGDKLDTYRHEVNKVLTERGIDGNNSIIRSKYVTLGVTADDRRLAAQKLSRMESDIAQHFKTIGSALHRLDGEQRLDVLNALLKPEEPLDFLYDDLVLSGKTTKDFICPSSFDFKDRRTFRFGDKIGMVLYASKLPDRMTDDLLYDISDLPFNLALSLHVQAEDQNKALDYVRKQIAFMDEEAVEKQRKASKSGYSAELALPHEFKFTYKKTDELMKSMEELDQHLFHTTLTAYIYGDTEEEVKHKASQIIATARTKGVTFSPLDFEQEYALNSVLPLGRNYVHFHRTLTTAAATILMPFMNVDLMQPGGMNYGVNMQSNALIAFDRTKLRASNGIVLGTPGSGKGMFAKQEIINIRLSRPDDDIIIIDPESEYAPLAHLLGGEVLHIHGGSATHLNPLDMSESYGDNDDPLTLKLDFLCSFIEQAFGGRIGLSGSDVSLIDRAMHETYLEYLSQPDGTNMPTMVDFYRALLKQPEPRAKNLALEMEAYITGSLNVFSYKTNVNLDNHLVVYDIKQLGKHLRSVGMLTVLDQVWNQITSNRSKGKRTWIYIDEMQLLFNNHYCSEYFFELWSRARKWGAVPTGITQNVETMLDDENARRMLSNTDFVVMLNQAKSDSSRLAQLLSISPQQLGFITNVLPGHGLMNVEGRLVPFNSEFPKHTELYKAMTTKLEEVAANTGHSEAASPARPYAAQPSAPVTEVFPLALSVRGSRLKTVTDGKPIFEDGGIEDAGFRITSADGKQTFHPHTDRNGEALLHLASGSYVVTPTEVPDGYLFAAGDASRTVTVDAANHAAQHYTLLSKSSVLTIPVSIEEQPAFGLYKDGVNREIGLYAVTPITAEDGSSLPAGSLLAKAAYTADAEVTVTCPFSGTFLLSQLGCQESETVPHMTIELHPTQHKEPYKPEQQFTIPIPCELLRGVKFDEDGNALCHTDVGLFPQDCATFDRASAVLITQTDGDGNFRFSIPKTVFDNGWKTRIL